MAPASAPDSQTTALLRNLVVALEDKKAEQLKVLQVGGVSDITDYLVLATGNSEPHLRALRIEAERVLDAAQARIAGTEQGGFGSGWTVLDAYQIMIHFFTAEQRENYALEKLWKDSPEVDVSALLSPKAPVLPAKKAAGRKAPARVGKGVAGKIGAAAKKKTPRSAKPSDVAKKTAGIKNAPARRKKAE